MSSLVDDPNFWSAISAVGGATSALAAFATIWQMRKNNAEARDAMRPYFTLEAPGFKPLPSSNCLRLILPLRNVGSRLAIYVEGRIYIATKTQDLAIILDHRFTIANAVPPNIPTPWYNDSVQLPSECPAHYVFLGIEYIDPGTSRRHRQPFYMRWDGVQMGMTQPDFVHVTEHERSDIKARFSSIVGSYESDA